MTRRLQFGLKDDKAEEKADKKKDRKRKANAGSEAKTTDRKKGKNKGKGKAKAEDSSKKVKGKKCKSKGLSKLRRAKSKSISPKKEAPVEIKTPCEAASGSNKKAEEPPKTKAKAAPKKGKGKQGEPDLPQKDIDLYKQKVEEGIAACCDKDCEHSWEVSDFSVPDQYQLSAYWSRDAVGLKVFNDLMEGQKPKTGEPQKTEKTKQQTVPKSKNFSQVAYFGSSGCIYMNMVLAHTLAL